MRIQSHNTENPLKSKLQWPILRLIVFSSQADYFFKFQPCLYIFFIFYFSIRLLSVLRGHSFFSSPPQRPMTSDFEGFLYQILSITLFSYLDYILNFIYFTSITKQVIQLILIMLVGNDVCVWMVVYVYIHVFHNYTGFTVPK